MKLERKHFITYIDGSFGGSGSPSWFLIGKDIEDMAVELNPDTEVVKNILGETTVKDNGYEPSMSADPYYANPDDGLFYEKIKDISFNRKKGDECKTKVLEVIIDKESGPYDAWTEDVVVKPQSIGGGTEGVNIPYEVLYNGNRVAGKCEISSGVPTFSTPS